MHATARSTESSALVSLGVVSGCVRCVKACGNAVVLTSEEQGISGARPWEVSDELCELIEPLIPQPHRPYGHPGRKRIDDRKTLRSEEHTSELQSRGHLVCRLLLEK